MNKFIEAYIKKEKFFLSKKIKIHRFFQPVLFKKLNYNVYASKKKDILPYVDMHQPDRYYRNIKNGGLNFFRKREKYLKKKIERHIKTEFGSSVDIKDSFSRSLISYRFIKKKFKKTSVFEIGPGSGYLGILLKDSNYLYSSFEITRPHFIFQNYIFKKIFKKNSPISILKKTDFKKIKKNGFHLPWWEISNIEKYLELTKPNLIIFCHCINEMHAKALDKFCQIIKNLKYNPTIFIEGYGSEEINSTNNTLFKLASNDINIFYHKPVKKYDLTRSLSIPITLLSKKQKKTKIIFFNFKGLFFKFGIKRIADFFTKLYKIKFDFNKWKIFFIDFLIIDYKK